LSNAVLLESDNGTIRLGSTDLSTENVHNAVAIEGPYPNWRQILPSSNRVLLDDGTELRQGFRVGIGLAVLDTLVAFGKKLKQTGDGHTPFFELRFLRPEKDGNAIEFKCKGFQLNGDFNGQQADGVIMPIRRDALDD